MTSYQAIELINFYLKKLPVNDIYMTGTKSTHMQTNHEQKKNNNLKKENWGRLAKENSIVLNSNNIKKVVIELLQIVTC